MLIYETVHPDRVVVAVSRCGRRERFRELMGSGSGLQVSSFAPHLATCASWGRHQG
jgi:hypothetical protein